ncbi:MAG: hypothetical protein GVY32_12460 [Gammaproteobacteria bacterium]|jgi:hypothetical protein|nr:hypothetical protein [Gammaproteobacteria bacterium]
MRTLPKALSVATALLLAGCASSLETTTPPGAGNDEQQPVLVGIPAYREFLTRLDQAVARGAARPLEAKERQSYRSASDRLDTLLARHESIDDMSQRDRVDAFNLHQELQAIVVGNYDDQIICRIDRAAGTNFPITQCRSVAERRRLRELTQDWKRSTFRGIMPSAPGGGGGP